MQVEGKRSMKNLFKIQCMEKYEDKKLYNFYYIADQT